MEVNKFFAIQYMENLQQQCVVIEIMSNNNKKNKKHIV